MDRVRVKYANLYPNDLEIRVITEGLLKETEDVKRWQRYDVFRRGWRFNQMGETWSPPEESPLEPNGQPLPISSFGLLPDFSMRLPSNKIIQLRYSFMPGYYDSVKFIIRWLEQIARGESGRVFIDLDDRYQEYISYPKEHDNLRLIVNYYPESSENKQELQLDILVPCRVVVEQFYLYIKEVFCREERPEEYQINKEDYRSDLIEEYLLNPKSL